MAPDAPGDDPDRPAGDDEPAHSPDPDAAPGASPADPDAAPAGPPADPDATQAVPAPPADPFAAPAAPGDPAWDPEATRPVGDPFAVPGAPGPETGEPVDPLEAPTEFIAPVGAETPAAGATTVFGAPPAAGEGDAAADLPRGGEHREQEADGCHRRPDRRHPGPAGARRLPPDQRRRR